MVDALTGWLGMTLIGLTVVVALALEVRDERTSADGTVARTDGDSRVVARRSRGAGRVLQLLLAVLVAGCLAATVVRLATLAF
ncbi:MULTISPECIES: hypothetical protein [unclassified Geodermatophilus]|uniref:hypothetical protein n=1 Tax=unclassified Geodermatophilus TaxID=2637632 RepID=UPI003EEFA589